ASDNKWGYPEYILGWYGLFSNNVDSVLHFSKAVAIDWNFLQRIKHDRICQKFPDIVHQVQQKVIVAKT
ncbi:MAG: hypothetical protein JWM09_680, partial [Francisellaceae bacterium]|nr:hypothetical protein [Francisellaceae bacterium]